MSDVRYSVARILIGAGLVVMLSACQTWRYAEVSSAEHEQTQSAFSYDGMDEGYGLSDDGTGVGSGDPYGDMGMQDDIGGPTDDSGLAMFPPSERMDMASSDMAGDSMMPESGMAGDSMMPDGMDAPDGAALGLFAPAGDMDIGMFGESDDLGNERFDTSSVDMSDGMRDEGAMDASELFGGDDKRDSMGMASGSGMTGDRDVGMSSQLEHVFFDYDKYTVRNDAITVLQDNVALLESKYRGFDLLIEGHCDERGTTNYNIELGKRRAQAVKAYLVDLGVDASRIHIVSYGKERPFCMASEPSCWQQNRRAHFVLESQNN